MKREWSGCERRRCTLGRYRIPYRRRSVPRRRVVLLRRAFQRPARPRPSRSDALPAQVPRQAPDLAVASGRHRSNPAPACDPLFRRSAPTRVACSAYALPSARRWQRTSLRNIRKMPQRAGPAKGRFPMGLRRQGRRVCLRPGQARRPAPPGPGVDCRVQAASARRSSGVMRASTALRTSGPASCSMALQSAVLWMVAIMPRSMS